MAHWLCKACTTGSHTVVFSLPFCSWEQGVLNSTSKYTFLNEHSFFIVLLSEYIPCEELMNILFSFCLRGILYSVFIYLPACVCGCLSKRSAHSYHLSWAEAFQCAAPHLEERIVLGRDDSSHHSPYYIMQSDNKPTANIPSSNIPTWL